MSRQAQVQEWRLKEAQRSEELANEQQAHANTRAELAALKEDHAAL